MKGLQYWITAFVKTTDKSINLHLFSHLTNYTNCQNNHIYLSIYLSIYLQVSPVSTRVVSARIRI